MRVECAASRRAPAIFVGGPEACNRTQDREPPVLQGLMHLMHLSKTQAHEKLMDSFHLGLLDVFAKPR